MSRRKQCKFVALFPTRRQFLTAAAIAGKLYSTEVTTFLTTALSSNAIASRATFGGRSPDVFLAQRLGCVRKHYSVGVMPILIVRRQPRIFFDGAQQA
jgi:hypothetical protein